MRNSKFSKAYYVSSQGRDDWLHPYDWVCLSEFTHLFPPRSIRTVIGFMPICHNQSIFFSWHTKVHEGIPRWQDGQLSLLSGNYKVDRMQIHFTYDKCLNFDASNLQYRIFCSHLLFCHMKEFSHFIYKSSDIISVHPIRCVCHRG